MEGGKGEGGHGAFQAIGIRHGDGTQAACGDNRQQQPCRRFGIGIAGDVAVLLAAPDEVGQVVSDGADRLARWPGELRVGSQAGGVGEEHAGEARGMRAVSMGGRVTGIDPSEPAITYARRHAPGNCSFAVAMAQRTGAADCSFDVVTSTLAVHHIPEAQRPEAFREMYRVTRPGGRLLVADFRPSGRRFTLHSAHAMRHGNPALIEGLAAAAGFRVEERGDLPLLHYIQAVRPHGT